MPQPAATLDLLNRLREAIASLYFGQPATIDRLLQCLLARGHCLIEDVPGVGKTLLASSLARGVDCSFARIQLTPDLTPSDIIGGSIYRREREVFEFQRGPLFANIVLADEINRATPRTQTALLEAMSDGAVTVDGHTHKLEQPFMLVATQNPSDFEGTFPLPENQLDRFLMRITLGYPSAENEARVITIRPANGALQSLSPVLHAREVVDLQAQTDAVRIDPSLIAYIIALANATRRHDALELGLSPRGSLALAQAARAAAVLAGRDYCVPDDVVLSASAVCGHRMIARATGPGGSARHADAVGRVLEQILETIPSPA